MSKPKRLTQELEDTLNALGIPCRLTYDEHQLGVKVSADTYADLLVAKSELRKRGVEVVE